MSEKKRENCTVVSQECIAAGIYSLWIQTEKIAADAKPGQFVSMYTKDKTKLLPRPISICEIDKEQGRLHLVYRYWCSSDPGACQGDELCREADCSRI